MAELTDYFEEFASETLEHLQDDQARWGDTWKYRPRDGQEQRIRARYNDYFDAFEHGGTPVDWYKVVGNAFIAWVRENYPSELKGE